MKEDDVDRDKRCESVEKQKSAKDLEKKKEKKKNLERQALETRRAKSRQRGEPEEHTPDEDDGNEGDDGSDDSDGMVARLDKILEGPPQADVVVPQTGPLRGRRVGPAMANGGSPLRAILALIPLLCVRRVRLSPAPNLLPRLRRATGSSLWRRGR